MRAFLESCLKNPNKLEFSKFLPDIEEDALDLLKKLLCYDPAQRLSALEAMRHPYFKNLSPLSDPSSSISAKTKAPSPGKCLHEAKFEREGCHRLLRHGVRAVHAR